MARGDTWILDRRGIYPRTARRAPGHQRAHHAACESCRASVHAQTEKRVTGVGIAQQRCGRYSASPYFAAKAGMDAVSYARELALWESRPPSSCQEHSPVERTNSHMRAALLAHETRRHTRPLWSFGRRTPRKASQLRSCAAAGRAVRWPSS